MAGAQRESGPLPPDYPEHLLTSPSSQAALATQTLSILHVATNLQLILMFSLACMTKKPYGKCMALRLVLR